MRQGGYSVSCYTLAITSAEDGPQSAIAVGAESSCNVPEIMMRNRIAVPCMVWITVLICCGTVIGQNTGESVSQAAATSSVDYGPVVMLAVGIISVLGLIIGLKLNAFLALIISALIVSLMVGITNGQPAGSRMNAVVDAFGGAAGAIPPGSRTRHTHRRRATCSCWKRRASCSPGPCCR